MDRGILFRSNFIQDSMSLFHVYRDTIAWNENMISRKTACYGAPYDYSEQVYDFQPMLPDMQRIALKIKDLVGWQPNNCLLNYYPNGKSKIGFHADTTVMLAPNTGIAIISLGAPRTFVFRKIEDKSCTTQYLLPSGSLMYMSIENQSHWQHGIRKENTDAGRISLTFRQMVS